MNSERQKYLQGSPQEYGESLYWEFSRFENLTVDEVKTCCCITLKAIMAEGDTASRLYFGEAKNYIKQRGVQG